MIKKILIYGGLLFLLIILFHIDNIRQEEVRFDHNITNDQVPIILVHGFNPLNSQLIAKYSLNEMAMELAEDLNYTNIQVSTPTSSCDHFATEKPFITRVNYFETLNPRPIDSYSTYLHKVIERIKECTNIKQVDIISYSMGGVVSRHRIVYKENNDVRTLILIASPNHGGLYNVGTLADIFVQNKTALANLDFPELSANHPFMKELNKQNESQYNITYYTIAGNIDGRGDGVVLEASVPLPNVTHFQVECGHITIKVPRLCPRAYQTVLNVFSPAALNEN